MKKKSIGVGALLALIVLCGSAALADEQVYFSGAGITVTQKDLAAENEMLSSNFQTKQDVKLKVILTDRLFMKEYLATNNDPLLQKKIERMTEKYLSLLYKKRLKDSLDISDEVLLSFYTANPELYTTPEKFHLKMIMLPHQFIAENIKSEIEGGKRSFEAAAFKESIDKETSEKKGDLGWLELQRMPTVFGDHVKNLSPGELTSPFKYGDKWVVLKLEARQTSEQIPFEKVKAGIRDILTPKEQIKQIESEFERLKTKYQVQ